jgi:GrpB-like predicted nucleotidyltransferase (UPF0157 family)
VPFADEHLQVVVVDYRPSWVAEFDALTVELAEALGDSGGVPQTGLRAADRCPPMQHHVRESRGGNARYALLFRDFLRSDDGARQAWGAFKQRLAVSVPDLLDYGQIKAPATDVLMAAAERWAAETGWAVT